MYKSTPSSLKDESPCVKNTLEYPIIYTCYTFDWQ